MTQTELPPMEWPAITILILLALAVVATIFYVRSVTRTGFNDPPAGEEEDNSIGEALNWRNEQEFKSHL